VACPFLDKRAPPNEREAKLEGRYRLACGAPFLDTVLISRFQEISHLVAWGGNASGPRLC
jgi:hypothetical protein